jgi:hypothetical protein
VEAAHQSNGTYVLRSRTEQWEHPHVRRLHELERIGLAVREAGDRWKVAPDLLRRLEERDRSAPSPHRILVRKEPLSLEDQVRYRPRCQDDVVRIGRTVLLPIEAAEAALRSLAAEANVTVQEDERGDEQPESVDAVLASVNMKRSA